MVTLSKDIIKTLVIKIILFTMLWFFFVKGHHPNLDSSDKWMLGHNISNPSAYQSIKGE